MTKGGYSRKESQMRQEPRGFSLEGLLCVLSSGGYILGVDLLLKIDMMKLERSVSDERLSSFFVAVTAVHEDPRVHDRLVHQIRLDRPECKDLVTQPSTAR